MSGDPEVLGAAEPLTAEEEAAHRQHIHRDGCHRWFDHRANELLDLVGPAGWCDGCTEDWPCDTTRALNRRLNIHSPRLDVARDPRPVGEGLSDEALVEAWRESSRHPLDSSSLWHNDLQRARRFLALTAQAGPAAVRPVEREGLDAGSWNAALAAAKRAVEPLAVHDVPGTGYTILRSHVMDRIVGLRR